MVIWNVTLFDRVLVSVTDEKTAERLVTLLNNGTLHGVPGDPAAYTDARATRTAPTTTAAAVASDAELVWEAMEGSDHVQLETPEDG